LNLTSVLMSVSKRARWNHNITPPDQATDALSPQ
jgi:hypothetical protein